MLEREQHLQIDTPAGRAGRKWSAGQRVRRAKQRRIEIPDGRRIVHVIQQISSADAERQVVFAGGFSAENKRTAPASAVSPRPPSPPPPP